MKTHKMQTGYNVFIKNNKYKIVRIGNKTIVLMNKAGEAIRVSRRVWQTLRTIYKELKK